MPKHLYLLIVSTFLFGFATGAILFFVTNTGQDGNGKLDDAERGIEIVVRAYGGCEMSGGGRCPTYRIGNNGAYTYIHLDSEGEVVQSSGELSNTQMFEIRRAVRTAVDKTYDPFLGTCPIAFDGFVFVYEITVDANRYVYDSCEYTLAGEVLFEKLNEYFESFDVIHNIQ